MSAQLGFAWQARIEDEAARKRQLARVDAEVLAAERALEAAQVRLFEHLDATEDQPCASEVDRAHHIAIHAAARRLERARTERARVVGIVECPWGAA